MSQLTPCPNFLFLIIGKTTKELSLCQKRKFSYPYIFAMVAKIIGIRKSEFVAKTRLLFKVNNKGTTIPTFC